MLETPYCSACRTKCTWCHELTQQMPEVDFKIVCSKGTYIRSLARDLGEALNSGAHLTSLCRTRIGNYLLKDAMSVEEFEKIVADFAKEKTI